MYLAINAEQGIQWIINILRKDQSTNGSWDYPFETGLSTDVYTIILLRSMEINDEDLIQGLVSRILSKQEKNGAWKLFYNENDGNLTATLEAYNGLLYSGYFKKDDKRLQAAKRFILTHGGIEKVNFFTKIMLAITGQYKWPAFFPIPIEIILLPSSFLVNFYDFSVYGRVNLAPLLILTEKQFSIKTKNTPDLSDLLSKRSKEDDWGVLSEWRSFLSVIEKGINNLVGLPDELHALAIDRTKKYMLERIEADGTLYSYYTSTLLMIFALRSLGYSKNDPLITNAISGIKSMKTEINGLPHMQFTTAHVWNTSLISSTLQLAQVPSNDPVIRNANRYLLEHQQDKWGDWAIHNPNGLPGGWGFSNVNTVNPDIDDTTAALRSIAKGTLTDLQFRDAWDRGINWLFSMQNDDGGWASFEKNVTSNWHELLPIEKSEFIFGDLTSADLTGRTLEFLGNYTDLPRNHSTIKRAINWLLKNQEKDGSWYGRWGICYLYGTWAAVTGLISVGLPTNHRSIQQAVSWLKKTQNQDGGWGESCQSDLQGKYLPLQASTLTDTSWALDSLITVAEKPTEEIQKGIVYLLQSIKKKDWTTNYPKGQAISGNYYIHYHSYRYIFPLLALSHYQQKFHF